MSLQGEGALTKPLPSWQSGISRSSDITPTKITIHLQFSNLHIPHCSRLLLLTLVTTSQDSSPPGSILEDLFRNNRNILVLSYDAKKIQSTKLEYEKNLKMQMNTIILQCTSQ